MKNKQLFSQISSSSEENLINLTPLIDVVFVVLISFILIAPLTQIDEIQLASGGDTQKKMQAMDHGDIVINVNKVNEIFLNGKETQIDFLKSDLLSLKKTLPKAIPTLQQDKQACFGTYQNIKNIVESCGFEQLDVILAPN